MSEPSKNVDGAAAEAAKQQPANAPPPEANRGSADPPGAGASQTPTPDDWAEAAKALGAQVAAEAQPSALTAEQLEQVAAKAAAEAVASMTPAPEPAEPQQTETPEQQLDVGALMARVDGLEAKQAAAAEALRNVELGKLGVLEKYRQFAPKADASTDAGKLELEKWASENRELAPGRRPEQPVADFDKLPKGGIWGVTPAKVAEELH
jgi:hypothetical protein